MHTKKLLHVDRYGSTLSITKSDDDSDAIITCESSDGNSISVYIPSELFVEFERIGSKWEANAVMLGS
jgi:hypothetical protein